MTDITSVGDGSHKVRIHWGEADFEYAQKPVIEYAFQTLGELNAFLLGVDESNGWMNYTQIDPNRDGTWPKEEEADEPND